MSWRDFVLVVMSGFCPLVYELVRLRLAMASLDVAIAMVSIVLLGLWRAREQGPQNGVSM
jgi:hypothetical protein